MNGQQPISIEAFRRRRRREWLGDNEQQLESFFQAFTEVHGAFNLAQSLHQYANRRRQYGATWWDQEEWREFVLAAIDAEQGQLLYTALCAERWFDARFLCRHGAIERYLSALILGQPQFVAQADGF